MSTEKRLPGAFETDRELNRGDYVINPTIFEIDCKSDHSDHSLAMRPSADAGGATAKWFRHFAD